MPEPPTLPPIAAEPISVVLLAHNPGTTLEPVVEAWHAVFAEHPAGFELILLDDGSTDGTPTRAVELMERFPHLHVVSHVDHYGLGVAHRSALAIGRYPLLLTVPCDGTYDAADAPRLLAEIDKVHIVCAVRASAKPPGWWRLISAAYRGFMRVAFGVPLDPPTGWLGWRDWWFRRYLWLVSGVRVQDVLCPFRLYRRQAFDRMALQSRGVFVLAEILAKGNFLGCVMTEVPVHDHPDAASDVLRDPPSTSWGRDRRRVMYRPRFHGTPGPVEEPPEETPVPAVATRDGEPSASDPFSPA